MEQSLNIPVRDNEIEVANILLELPYLIFESESRPRFSFAWGVKRKRSTAAKEQVAATTSSPALKPLSSSPPPPSLPYQAEAPMEKVLTSSPATPLSFSPSESDEKLLPSKKKASVNNLKRKKEQLQEMMNDFSRCNELLKRDIEEKKRLLDQQKAENFELKAKKHKLSLNLGKEEEPRLETRQSLNLEIRLAQISAETETSTSQDYHHHQQQQQKQQRVSSTMAYQQQQRFIMDQTAYKPEVKKNSQYPFFRTITLLTSNTEGLSNLHDNGGPIGLLDLNVSAGEALGFSSGNLIDEYTAAAAKARTAAQAQARLKRKQILDCKKSQSQCCV
ncbi:hypothetical protein PTKIN_Ptkin09bG0106700 [Pterospermum kingtungense]